MPQFNPSQCNHCDVQLFLSPLYPLFHFHKMEVCRHHLTSGLFFYYHYNLTFYRWQKKPFLHVERYSSSLLVMMLLSVVICNCNFNSLYRVALEKLNSAASPPPPPRPLVLLLLEMKKKYPNVRPFIGLNRPTTLTSVHLGPL